MSVQTLCTAATGMGALETKLDVIANNLANVNTTAFKRDRANFEDLFYRHYTYPGAADSAGNATPTGVSVGMGTRVSSTQTDFDQGAFQQTNNQLDLAIEGNGMFAVEDATTGDTLYTRAGNFSINANNELVMGSASSGRKLTDGISIPTDATSIVISPDGQVQVRQPNNNALSVVGQLNLTTFPNPDGLEQMGDSLYRETGGSGAPVSGTPGQSGIGIVRQSVLEASNVEPVQELIDLIQTQRAFEMNSQVVQAGDQVMQLVANLQRF